MASGFDVTNNFVVVILAEAIATGSKGGSLVAPDPPVPYYNYWVNRWVFNFDGPTESDIIYDVNAVDYNVKASDHFGAQVAPDADYWNLNFTVNKLTWGF
jgi:hypothetical protein